jgi:hypothetical protein
MSNGMGEYDGIDENVGTVGEGMPDGIEESDGPDVEVVDDDIVAR